MDRFVVTIARENGSGGRVIGEQLADRLKVPFYNRALLRLASDESGISEQLFAKADEDARHARLFRIARDALRGEVIPPDRDDFVSNENLFRYQARIILELANTESCVIIGRCADYILKDHKNVLRIFIHAPLEDRVAIIMRRHNLSEEAARKEIARVDKRRANYYRTFTGSDWRDAGHYDLCLDSAALGQKKCVELAAGYLSLRLGVKI
ncbi:MAG TPA: cytidylate kinase-like family protein [Candidatus Pygmaiobacter gallistercoris]|nr:cytidylate kinase-like family protein [Candidatus Pygmaiobacter gallistercoris]